MGFVTIKYWICRNCAVTSTYTPLPATCGCQVHDASRIPQWIEKSEVVHTSAFLPRPPTCADESRPVIVLPDTENDENDPTH